MNNKSEKIKIYSFSEITSMVMEHCNRINPLLQDDGKIKEDSVLDFIDQLIQYLEELSIDSYEFTYGANKVAQNLSSNVCGVLLEKIKNFSQQVEQDNEEKNRDNAFIVYYLMAYLYRLHDPESLSGFLEEYEDLFLKHYALTYQIRGRELRAKGKLEDAIWNDKLALNMLNEKGVENIGIKVTYAASIAMALECGVKGIEQSEIQASIDDVNQAIQMNRTYPRYYYLLAKIKLYRTRNAVYATNNMDTTLGKWLEKKEVWNKELEEADELIEKALNLLNKNKRAESYSIFWGTYNVIKEYIKRLQSDIELFGMIYVQIQQFKDNIFEKFQELTDQSKRDNRKMVEEFLESEKEELNKNNEDKLAASQERIENEIQDTLQKSQNRYLEILAVFVAIVGVMITTIGLVTNNFSFREVIFGIIVMNAGILAVYTCFKMILSKEIHPLYVVILGITCFVILFSLIFGSSQIWINFFWRINK